MYIKIGDLKLLKIQVIQNGVTVYEGGFRIKDTSGTTILGTNGGTIVVEDIYIKDTSVGSWLYTSLMNMAYLKCGEIQPSRIKCNETDFYIGEGYTLQEAIERVIAGQDI